ncbi:MAG: sigma-70 family RNA polymerase sigma factor [Stellaceae bacterium]
MTDISQQIDAEIPRLRRYARALMRNATAADDLVQDCLIRAISKQHLWKEGTDLRAWLFTILHNQHINLVRRSVPTLCEIRETDPQLTCAPGQNARLALRDLDRALARLPKEQRTVVLLIGLEGMSYETAAEVTGVPVGTVRSRLSRGRDALREMMEGIPRRPAAATAQPSNRPQSNRPQPRIKAAKIALAA